MKLNDYDAVLTSALLTLLTAAFGALLIVLAVGASVIGYEYFTGGFERERYSYSHSCPEVEK